MIFHMIGRYLQEMRCLRIIFWRQLLKSMKLICLSIISFILMRHLPILINLGIIFLKILIWRWSIVRWWILSINLLLRNLIRHSLLLTSIIVSIVNNRQILLRTTFDHFSITLRPLATRIHLSLLNLTIKYDKIRIIQFFILELTHRHPIIRIHLLRKLRIRKEPDLMLRRWKIELLSIH